MARDVAAFEARAHNFDDGWLGRLHHEIADRAVTLALAAAPTPRRVLDVGCGTGYLLRTLAGKLPHAEYLAGIDPAPAMVEAATTAANDGRLRFSTGAAEQLPYLDDHFDLVVTTTSFDHWSNQLEGLRECRRVLQRGGQLVLVDQFSLWLLPTLVGGRHEKARTKERGEQLLHAAGFAQLVWHDLYAMLIKAVTATA